MMPFAGIDGCKGGWICVRWDGVADSTPVAVFLPHIRALDPGSLRAAAIDMPVGFMDVVVAGGRKAERAARRFLPGKTSSIFSAPCRAALATADFKAALAVNRAQSRPPGIGLSRQSAMLIPKLRELDDFITPDLQDRIFEAHPEVAFAIMNGHAPVLSKKRKTDGHAERIALLARNGFPVTRLHVAEQASGRWSRDDVVDACACAWSARRIDRGWSMAFPPSDPPRDARGLRMQIRA